MENLLDTGDRRLNPRTLSVLYILDSKSKCTTDLCAPSCLREKQFKHNLKSNCSMTCIFYCNKRNDSLQTLLLFIGFDQSELNVSNCVTNKMPPLNCLCKEFGSKFCTPYTFKSGNFKCMVVYELWIFQSCVVVYVW